MQGTEKAKKVFTIYDKNCNIVTYNYKGYEYDVVYPTSWTFCTTPAYIQHQDAQRKINEAIEAEKKPKRDPEVQKGLDFFFDYLES
jgi:hypothetical protein